ncbi:MAG: carbon-nitrogen hydrolase family protein [Planctomycetota bacterium]
MLLACVQTDVQFANVAGNLETVLRSLGDASEADLVVFPECMLTGYGFQSRQEAIDVAPLLHDEWVEVLTSAAAKHDCHIVLGTLLRSDQARDNGLMDHAPEGDGHCDEAVRLTNSSVLIGPDGLCGRYDKIHLPHLGVDRFVDRGQLSYQSWPTNSGCRIGLAICYDCSFPEPMRALGLAGADVIALGTNWPVAAARTAEIVPPARSMENHLFFVAANRIGHERGFDFCGRSSICGPDGIELARAEGAAPEILFADIRVEDARNKRIERTAGQHVIDRFADRRPEFYGSLIQSDAP